MMCGEVFSAEPSTLTKLTKLTDSITSEGAEPTRLVEQLDQPNRVSISLAPHPSSVARFGAMLVVGITLLLGIILLRAGFGVRLRAPVAQANEIIPTTVLVTVFYEPHLAAQGMMPLSAILTTSTSTALSSTATPLPPTETVFVPTTTDVAPTSTPTPQPSPTPIVIPIIAPSATSSPTAVPPVVLPSPKIVAILLVHVWNSPRILLSSCPVRNRPCCVARCPRYNRATSYLSV